MTRGFRGRYKGDPQLNKLSDREIRLGELRDWATVKKACDLHLADLVREHARALKRRRRAAQEGGAL